MKKMEKKASTSEAVDSRKNSSHELNLNRRERRRLTRAQRHQLASNKSFDWSNTERRTSESSIQDVHQTGRQNSLDDNGERRLSSTTLIEKKLQSQLEDCQQSTDSVESATLSEAAAELQYETSESRNWSTEKTKKYGRSSDETLQYKFESSKTAAYMFKAKILVIGPRECGKTVISNYLADATEISGGDYHPTQGVRILEFESSGIAVGNKDLSCEVELWDCSGDQKFENCWPAIQKDANGILFVYNPDNTSHGKELETLYVHFVQEQGLRDTQCMLFAHHKPGANEKARSQIPSYLSKIPCVQTNLEDDSDVVKQKFNDLLAVLLRNWTDRRDQEELSIMNN